MQISLIGLAILAGFVTLLSPCILPIVPILIGRSLRSHRYGPIALVVGLAISFAGTGILLGLSAQFLAPLSSWIRQIAIGVLLVLGLGSIFPKISHRVFQWIAPPQFQQPAPVVESGSASRQLWLEFLIGTQLGVIWIPCAGPVLGSILTLVAVNQSFAAGFVALLAYALGAGIPMLAVAYGSRGLGQRIRQLNQHTERIQRVAGVLISLAAVSIALGWDRKVQIWLAPLFPPLPL